MKLQLWKRPRKETTAAFLGDRAWRFDGLIDPWAFAAMRRDDFWEYRTTYR